MRLTSVDLPTFGRPTTASTGCASAASSAASAASICASSLANSVSSDQVPSTSPTLSNAADVISPAEAESNSAITTQFPLWRNETVFGTPIVQSLHERRELAAQLLGALVEPGLPGSDLRRERLPHEDVHARAPAPPAVRRLERPAGRDRQHDR